MLNEWSDRDPDPPGRPGWRIALAILIAIATAIFLLDLALFFLGD